MRTKNWIGYLTNVFKTIRTMGTKGFLRGANVLSYLNYSCNFSFSYPATNHKRLPVNYSPLLCSINKLHGFFNRYYACVKYFYVSLKHFNTLLKYFNKMLKYFSVLSKYFNEMVKYFSILFNYFNEKEKTFSILLKYFNEKEKNFTNRKHFLLLI